ncbi:hypothetical protein [Olivibacter jilunii]|uniref:hypothetical protein n=1 Tax=Olivibacter jilunii TaxID=985016 RepID=UPI003F5CC0DE
MNRQSKNKFEPHDSEQSTPEDNKVVKKKKDTQYKKELANLKSPAKKKEFSEQPPTKHNTHN